VVVVIRRVRVLAVPAAREHDLEAHAVLRACEEKTQGQEERGSEEEGEESRRTGQLTVGNSGRLVGASPPRQLMPIALSIKLFSSYERFCERER